MYPQIFGKYMLQGELASGGMARVFVATLRGAGGFEKRLAVKQIRPELARDPHFVEHFIQEAKTAVELTHPNIVPVYELGVEGGVYYIAMELCVGVTLAELLAAEGALGLETGAYIGVEVARALDYAHRRGGIVHRDVTPRNVLIDDEGAVRLIDFGIARPVAAGGSVEVFGSPGHMPPEQVRGETLTPAADVFALGALAIEACSGVAPFRRATERESLAAVESLPERPSEALPALESLDDVLLRAVHPSPSERLQSIDELGRALREALRNTDLGDLALDLGRRVRRVRRASHPGTKSEPPLALPSVGSPTRTFATRPLAQPPAAGAGQKDPWVTRPLSPPPAAPDSSTDRAAPRLTPKRLMSPLASLLVATALPLAALGMLWFRERAPASPVDANEPVVATSAAQSEPSSSKTSPPKPPPSPAAPSTAEPAPTGAAAEPSSARPALPEPSPAPPNPATSGAVDRLARPLPSAQDAPSGTVMLTAAPPASVTIGGRRLTTPVAALELPAGEYQATFDSPTWDGSLSARVLLEGGSARHVHADFTSEPPRVIVK